MIELISVRFNDHQEKDGVMDYVVEVALPSKKFSREIIGASLEEITPGYVAALKEIAELLEIPNE